MLISGYGDTSRRGRFSDTISADGRFSSRLFLAKSHRGRAILETVETSVIATNPFLNASIIIAVLIDEVSRYRKICRTFTGAEGIALKGDSAVFSPIHGRFRANTMFLNHETKKKKK